MTVSVDGGGESHLDEFSILSFKTNLLVRAKCIPPSTVGFVVQATSGVVWCPNADAWRDVEVTF